MRQILGNYMLLFDKTEPKKCKIRRCKAINGFNFFSFFLNTSYTIALDSPIKAIYTSND